MNILNFFHKQSPTLNLIEISKENLFNNYRYLSHLNQKIKVAPVVKSNAYGHGLVKIAQILEKCKPPLICVDSLHEAYELQKVNIKIPILIMGYTDHENFKVKDLPFSFTVFDLVTAETLNKHQPGCRIHIFVDTGMNREGIPLIELPDFLQEIKKLPNLKIEGLMSHLASANNLKSPLNNIQIKNFKKAIEICKKQKINPKWVHLQNSDGFELNLKGCNVNMARIGLALYGISNNPNLKPVLKLKTKIVQIKNLKPGNKVGYSETFSVRKEVILGLLPLGYYDGADRRLSNMGYVKVADIFCPIIGRVSMNITTVDISKVKNPYIGQEVTVYSDNPNDKNSLINSAKICKTIPYDLLVNLSDTTRRIIT